MEVDPPASPPAEEMSAFNTNLAFVRSSYTENPMPEIASMATMDIDLRDMEDRPKGKVDLLDMASRSEGEIYKERANQMQRGYNTPEYTVARNLENEFTRMIAQGDVYNIYRNRHVFVGKTEDEIVDIPKQVMVKVPSIRVSVLSYIGLLVHENTNCFFSEKENANFNVNYASVQSGALKLLVDFRAVLESSGCEQLLLDVLKWCCDLSSALSQNNSGRPITKTCKTPEHFMSLFITCAPIKEMISLMDFTIAELLKCNPDQCMSTLFYSSLHGTHFNWIWLHIADTFPGKVVENIFTIGGRQFKAYVDTIRLKTRETAPASILDQLHAEYRIRFQSLSEVFNFLMRRGNVDLKNTVSKMIAESLLSDVTDIEKTDYNIVFYFKLVTISQDTLRFLVEQNLHLATPQNFFRGMRQILSLDKEMILSRMSYQEFGVQMINELNPASQAAAFKALARLALDPVVVDGVGLNMKPTIQVIREGAFSAMCELINIMLVNAHTYEPVKPADLGTITTFANGSDLQFIIDTALSNPNWAPQLIRYLHIVSIAFSKNKAAEIACRLILTCTEPSLLHVLCAFLSSIVPFYPQLMKLAYKDLFSTRDTYLSESPVSYDSPVRRFQRNLAFLTNVRTLLEWDLNCEKDDIFLKSFDLHPRSLSGHVLCGMLSVCVSICAEQLKLKNHDNIHLIVAEIGRLLKSFVVPYAQQKDVIQHQSFVVKIRYIYKITLQLAHLLKIALLTVSKDSQHALVAFEDFRSNIMLFYADYVNQLHLYGQNRRTGMAQLFFISFLANCLTDNKELFGEDVELNSWKDSTIEQLRIDDDDEEYSFLDALQSMDTHQKISRLAHSGIIGQGAKHLAPSFIATDDQLIRSHVFLDAVRNTCVTQHISCDVVNTKHLANYLVEIVCQDAVASEILFQDWELEKEDLGKYQIVKKVYRSWLIRGLLNIVAENPPCLWLCLPILKAQLADILSSLLSTTSRSVKVNKNIMDLMDAWISLARKGDVIPKRFEYFVDFLPHVTVHEAYLLFLEIWRYFQRRTVTLNAVEHAIELEKNNRGSGSAILHDAYEGDFRTCRRIIQKHICELGHLFPKLFAPSLQQLSK